MNRMQTMDSPQNIEEQVRAAASIPIEGGLALHRLAEARRQEGISYRNLANHLGVTVQDVRRQECRTTDLPLSVLHNWATALGLPVAELVEEPRAALSTPLFTRARLVRVMKTAMAILEQTAHPQTKRLAQTMVDQLMEIMPELRGTGAWNITGQRRRRDELGVAAERSMSDDIFADGVE